MADNQPKNSLFDDEDSDEYVPAPLPVEEVKAEEPVASYHEPEAHQEPEQQFEQPAPEQYNTAEQTTDYSQPAEEVQQVEQQQQYQEPVAVAEPEQNAGHPVGFGAERANLMAEAPVAMPDTTAPVEETKT